MPCSTLFLPPEEIFGFAAALILRALILAEFLGCVNALTRVIAAFSGFALIRPSAPFSREREKGLVYRVIGGFLRLSA
ncbi:hypothetical protein [Xanthomonas arboricola]|uniref:hypothetical protein n=1 Tax=Xanthomonas arboricola TaxID=56448 RepID=UPI00161010D9|nr:hypothetical protein [Xanthomonas arboricola]MBB3761788.1 hypothetical protein [Xanthomonas arboricola]